MVDQGKMYCSRLILLCLFCPVLARSGVMVEAGLAHESMEMRIGYPAIIEPGQPYPVLSVENKSGHGLELRGGILRLDDGTTDQPVAPQRLAAGETARVAFEGAPQPGRYRWQFSLLDGGQTVFMDAYYFSVFDPRELPENYSRVVHPGEDGRLVYIPDYRGNRVPDFSAVGYRYGEKEIPEAPVRVTLEPEDGCNAARIQAAIDEVSALEPDGNGIRGAVLLKAGIYLLSGTVTIRADGVVLRGEGPGEDIRRMWRDTEDWLGLDDFKNSISGRQATVLITRGNRPLRINGAGGPQVDSGSVSSITDNYVPVGAHTFSVDKPENFSVGDKVIVRRLGNADWIREIGMDRIPGESAWGGSRFFNLDFDRRIIAIDGNRITTESPVVTAIEQRWEGGRVYRYDASGRVENSGIEGLRVIHNISRPSSTGGRAVRIRNARHVWVRDVAAEHFTDRGAFKVDQGARNVTVQDCSALVAAPGHFGGRGRGRRSYQVPRYGFFIRRGASHVLFSGCYARHSRHAFVLCAWVMGPNVYYNCTGEDNVTWSEPHHRWSAGGLYDNVTDYRIAIMNRLDMGSGHGWSGANFVAWNTRGGLCVHQPPTAQNWAIGHTGYRLPGWVRMRDWNMEQFGYSDGYWELHRFFCGSQVEASGYGWSRVPESTLDDDPGTYWMTRRRGEWIRYDLGRRQQIDALEISFPKQRAPVQDRVYYFRIQVSNGGRHWHTIIDRAEGRAAGEDVFHRYELPDVTARYVRLVALGSSMGGDGEANGRVLHMSRVRILPEPKVMDGAQDKGVVPESLYRQQLEDRLTPNP